MSDIKANSDYWYEQCGLPEGALGLYTTADCRSSWIAIDDGETVKHEKVDIATYNRVMLAIVDAEGLDRLREFVHIVPMSRFEQLVQVHPAFN